MTANSEDRVAIVTGGSRGIGLAIAQRLVADGYRVCITARHQDGLDAALAELPAGRAFAVAGKSDDAEHRAEVFRLVAKEYGRLDVLVANAGINPVYGPLADLELDAARKVLDVNLISTLAWVQGAVRDKTFAAAGAVVMLSSVTGQVASPGIGWYGVTKAAVSHLARTLAVELAPGVRVNAVAPALVRTEFARALFEGNEPEVISRYPAGRLGIPEDVAGLVAFLASDEASWITGQVITIDGGLLANGGRA